MTRRLYLSVHEPYLLSISPRFRHIDSCYGRCISHETSTEHTRSREARTSPDSELPEISAPNDFKRVDMPSPSLKTWGIATSPHFFAHGDFGVRQHARLLSRGYVPYPSRIRGPDLRYFALIGRVEARSPLSFSWLKRPDIFASNTAVLLRHLASSGYGVPWIALCHEAVMYKAISSSAVTFPHRSSIFLLSWTTIHQPQISRHGCFRFNQSSNQ